MPIRRSGRRIWRWWKAITRARCSSRPTAPASWAAARTIHNPAAIAEGWPLSNTAGPVLDPIFSLRRRVVVPRGSTVRVAFWTIVAPTREEVLELVEKYSDEGALRPRPHPGLDQAQMQLQHLGIRAADAHLYQRLANHVLFSDSTLRPPPEFIKTRDAQGLTLWACGVSGDLPIVLARVADDDDLNLVRQLLRGHEYWRSKGLAVDLVILNERASSYVQDFQGAIDALVRMNKTMRTCRAPT